MFKVQVEVLPNGGRWPCPSTASVLAVPEAPEERGKGPGEVPHAKASRTGRFSGTKVQNLEVGANCGWG